MASSDHGQDRRAKARRGLRRFTTVLLALVAAYLVLALTTARSGNPEIFPARPGEPAVTVFVVRNAYHSELALPTEPIRRRGGPTAQALERLGPTPWVMAGWGDAAFYAGRGISAARAGQGLRAALGLADLSAIRLTPLSRPADEIWETGVLPIRLSPKGFERLLDRLDASFQLRDGEPTVIARREAQGSLYFASREDFSLLYLCNHWTGELLHAAGAPGTPALHILPNGLVWDPLLRQRLAQADGAAQR